MAPFDGDRLPGENQAPQAPSGWDPLFFGSATDGIPPR